jgi:hypothetical protein
VDVGQHLLIGRRLTPSHKLLKAPFRAHLGARRDEKLHLGLGRNDGSGVATVEDGTTGPPGEFLLQLQKCRADLGHRGHARGGVAKARNRQALAVETGEIDLMGGVGRCLDIVERVTLAKHDFGDAAIEESRVEMRDLEMLAKPSGERALARGGGSVDRDNHLADIRAEPVHQLGKARKARRDK